MIRKKTQFYLLDAVENAELTTEQKVYFITRYMDLVQRYRHKYHRVNVLYNTLRLMVMVGSIFIPALLTLQKDPTTIISETTYWIVFGLSLCVTLSNSLLELFNVAALNTKYWLHVHRLEMEGWQFLHLSESYSRFENIQEAFIKFSSKVEKLNISLVFDLLRLENKNKPSTNTDVKGDSVSTNNGGNSMSTKNLFGMSRLPRPLELPQHMIDTVLDNESTDVEQKQQHARKPSLLVSLQEFQTRLDDPGASNN